MMWITIATHAVVKFRDGFGQLHKNHYSVLRRTFQNGSTLAKGHIKSDLVFQNDSLYQRHRSFSHLTLSCVIDRVHTKQNYGYLQVQQQRHISSEFYQKYLSPESPPIGFLQDLMEWTHSTTGLPWWASIVLTTFLLRTIITLPVAIYSQKVLVKVELLQPEIAKLAQRLKGEVAMATKQFNWKTKYARFKYNSTMKKLISELYIRDNCHPFKSSLVLWLQIPMWIGISFALRNMSGYMPFKGVDSVVLCPDFANEGLLWFSNLILPDTTFILPVTLGLLNLMVIEMNVLLRKDPSKFHRILTNVLRGVSVLMIPIGATVPSCMCLYWTCSSLFGLLQNIAFKMPKVKRVLGIPMTPSESSTPFQDMILIARQKYKWLPGANVGKSKS